MAAIGAPLRSMARAIQESDHVPQTGAVDCVEQQLGHPRASPPPLRAAAHAAGTVEAVLADDTKFRRAILHAVSAAAAP